MAETTLTVVGGDISNISVLPAAILFPCSTSFVMAVGRSVTLTSATPLPSGVTGNLVQLFTNKLMNNRQTILWV